MDHKEKHHLRLHILAALFFAVMALYLGVLYDTQVTTTTTTTPAPSGPSPGRSRWRPPGAT